MVMILVASPSAPRSSRTRSLRTLSTIVPYVHRISAFFLVDAGLYLVY
jgi:hypothetical protein